MLHGVPELMTSHPQAAGGAFALAPRANARSGCG